MHKGSALFTLIAGIMLSACLDGGIPESTMVYRAGQTINDPSELVAGDTWTLNTRSYHLMTIVNPDGVRDFEEGASCILGRDSLVEIVGTVDESVLLKARNTGVDPENRFYDHCPLGAWFLVSKQEFTVRLAGNSEQVRIREMIARRDVIRRIVSPNPQAPE